MSQLLINDYLAQLDLIKHVSGSQRETVVREAFKDLLKAWGRQRNLVFLAEYPLKTATKTSIAVDGALLHELPRDNSAPGSKHATPWRAAACQAKAPRGLFCPYSMPPSEIPASPRPSIVLMGVSGCGKTTVGQLLAARLDAPFVDGDSLHPRSNVAKMHAGIPLTDADRAPWLVRVGETLAQAGDAGIVVACSALKRAYRDTIQGLAPATLFLHLDAPHDLIAERLRARHGHFMPAALLDSQFAALEPLAPDEPGWVVDARRAAPAMVDATMRQLAARGLA